MTTVFTSRIGYEGTELVLDTTVKSGKGLGKVLAPTWEIVMAVKRGDISEATYEYRYLEILRDRYKADKQPFLDILAADRSVLLCYCRPGFCHRNIAVDVLEKIAIAHNIPFERGGEI